MANTLLAMAAGGFALCAVGITVSTDLRYRGRTDLDMPDWFVINMDLAAKILALGAAGGVCLFVAGCLFLSSAQTGRAARIKFIVHWLTSAACLGLVVLPPIAPFFGIHSNRSSSDGAAQVWSFHRIHQIRPRQPSHERTTPSPSGRGPG